MVKKLALCVPDIQESDVKRVADVLRSGQLVQGSNVLQLEQLVCEMLGCKHSIAFSSGTAPLYAFLKLLGVGPGDEVIVPAFSFVASANVVKEVGAEVKFVDVSSSSLCLDPARVEAAISPRTKAIMVVHEFGCPADVSRLKIIAESRNIPIIEDAACAFGTVNQGDLVGYQSELCSFSFHPRKIVTSGEGGLAVTNCPDIARKLRIARNHGIDIDVEGRSEKFVDYSLNFRMTDFQAALLLGQIDRYAQRLSMREEIARTYNSELAELPIWLPLLGSSSDKPNWQSYHIVLRNHCALELSSFLNSNGIQTTYGAQCIPLLSPYQSGDKQAVEKCYPVAHAAFQNGICLPIHHELSREDVIFITTKVKEFFYVKQ